ncbi:hypothetical protein SAMN05192551_103132 [Tindallia magadiensis]|uniref:Polysaccharide deacetylase n=1 Tax=Tindallia magadiensis TaxID=69895 RepID=A0A1I3D372_9FIRM|nr:hypothetical protein [Tindallia magadiensis]SFH81200.1 hypothetical protein SAMN05192551_103132 [Tindallia magadiensis]
MAKRIIKKNDGTDYINDFLNIINLKNVPMEKVNEISEPRFFIRHDVDHSIDMAVEIAEVEAKNGYTSTFFLLPPGSYNKKKNYYGWLENGEIKHDPELIRKCKEILSYGHQIGFHNDIIAASLKWRQDPAEILKKEVDYFHKNGVRLVGTAAHGSPLARELEFNNRELFEGCIRKGREVGRTIEYNNWKVKTHSLTLSDFGFEYEAYSLPRDSRISESGGKWGGRIVGLQIDKERLFNHFNLDEFQEIISRLQPDAKVKSMQVMTHPCHWEVV